MNNEMMSEKFEAVREQIHRQMLSAVSHDLKTPLASIIGGLEIYTRMHDRLSVDKRDMLMQSALREAYRLDGFITNILDMAKLENGMVVVKRERCDMASLVRDCILRLGPGGKGLAITITANNGERHIHTDPMLLSRAIGLVLDNTLKHAGGKAQVNVEYGSEDAIAFVRIHDNGQGIPKGKEKDIFSKYTRFIRNDQQNAGTGLGLPICRQIMVLLAGSVDVKNHPEGGAVFTIMFPSAP